MDTNSKNNGAKDSKPECFVIMPISDPEGYDKGHFRRVYEDLFQPACDTAGYKPVRADDVKETHLIHHDILRRLLDSPMAICDLSSRNPNVLFELGLRQAFDKPTVLVQERGTPRVFDISPISCLDYGKKLSYREVLTDQQDIAELLRTTKEAAKSGRLVNSIVSILSIDKAVLKDPSDIDAAQMFQILQSELGDLRSEIRKSRAPFIGNISRHEKMIEDLASVVVRAEKYKNDGRPDWVTKVLSNLDPTGIQLDDFESMSPRQLKEWSDLYYRGVEAYRWGTENTPQT